MADTPDVETEQVDQDTAKDIQEDFAEADEDITPAMRLTAGAQLVVLFVALGAGIVLAVTTGIIAPSIAITASISVGWVIEYLVIALVGAFILYVFSLLLIVLPGSMLNLLGGLAYGAAVSAGLVETGEEGRLMERERNNEEE